MRLKVTVAAFVALSLGGCYIVATPDGVGVGVTVRPIYSPIASTGIQVVTNASGNIFYYGGVYYRWLNGRWWRSPTWRSGWAPIAVVPRVFLNIPRTHPRYHVVMHHPLHPAHPVRPVPPAPSAPSAHPVHPAHPTHPAARAKVRERVEHGSAAPKVEHSSGPRPPKEKDKEKDEKGNKGRGRR